MPPMVKGGHGNMHSDSCAGVAAAVFSGTLNAVACPVLFCRNMRHSLGVAGLVRLDFGLNQQES